MSRRKGVPCGCDADPCGCSPKAHCVKAISNVSPDPNGDFDIQAGQNVTITPTDYGIEISAAGGSAEDVVKSVNGELPDEDGDVTVDVGIKTVNSIVPDSDGDFTISAGTNVTITPTANGVEIEADVPTIATSDPLYINSLGEIDIKDWECVDTVDWETGCISNGYTTEDFVILCNYSGNREFFYIPKGMPKLGLILVTHYNRTLTSYLLGESVFTVAGIASTYVYPLWSYQDTNTTMVEGFLAIKTGYGNNSKTLYKATTINTQSDRIFLLRRRKTE